MAPPQQNQTSSNIIKLEPIPGGSFSKDKGLFHFFLFEGDGPSIDIMCQQQLLGCYAVW